MLELLERQTALTANQWKIVVASILSIMLDFFDFLLIGFETRGRTIEELDAALVRREAVEAD